MAETLNWMARHTRHYKAGMTLLTQSANDAFLNKHTRAIMENTELHLLLYHNYISQEVRDFYKFIPQEEQYLTMRHNPKETGYSVGLLRLVPVKVPLCIYASAEEDYSLLPLLRREGNREDSLHPFLERKGYKEKRRG